MQKRAYLPARAAEGKYSRSGHRDRHPLRLWGSGETPLGRMHSAWEEKNIPAVVFSAHFPFSSAATNETIPAAAAVQ